MDIRAILIIIVFFLAIGACLFFVIRLFFLKEIKVGEKANGSSYLIATAVMTYLSLILIFGFNGQETIAKVMAVILVIFGIVGGFFIEKDHE